MIRRRGLGKLLLAGVVAAVLLVLTSPAGGADFLVDTTADGVDVAPGDASCASATGQCTLRAAVMETNWLPGADGITIPAGVYPWPIEIWDPVVIRGAGAGGTVIGRVTIEPTGPVDLVRLGISGGVVIPTGWLYPSLVSLVDCEVRDSAAAGVEINGGATRIERCTVTRNAGAGVAQTERVQLEIVDSTISDNGGNGIGSGGFFNSGPVVVTRSIVRGNGGSGIYFGDRGSSARIVESSFLDNAQRGIDVGPESSGLDLQRSRVSANRGGGIRIAGNGSGSNSHSIRDSLIDHNSTADSGGGLLVSDPETSISVLNTTISGNVATTAGGVLVVDRYCASGAEVRIHGSTVAYNQGPGAVGGVVNFSDPPFPCSAAAKLELSGTLIARNTGFGAADCYFLGAGVTVTSLGGNLIGDVTNCNFPFAVLDISGTVFSPLDPVLGPLASNGGPTPTHALLLGSPAIDAALSCEATDQRGVARPFDGNGDFYERCDIGAYEVADYDADGAVDLFDNCPFVANPGQEDGGSSSLESPADGVGDACDNCTNVRNPRLALDSLTANPWATLTGDQRDDDHDGYGNACDADFPGTTAGNVGPADLAQFRASNGESRLGDTCGTLNTLPCAIFDLDENTTSASNIGPGDLARFRALQGSPAGPKCPTCPLVCVPGLDGRCN